MQFTHQRRAAAPFARALEGAQRQTALVPGTRQRVLQVRVHPPAKASADFLRQVRRFRDPREVQIVQRQGEVPRLIGGERNLRIEVDEGSQHLSRLATPASVTEARAVKRSTSAGGIRITSEAIFISKASTFLPRYSGVRPTMRPATKTAISTKASMP